MKQNIEYTNDNLHIMPGFYESILFNSDTEYMENEQIRRDCEDNGEEFIEHEIKDFNEFQRAVCTRSVNYLIKPLLCEDSEICDDIQLIDVWSPSYYNFTTDKLNCNVNIDIDKLASMLQSNVDLLAGFDKYLYEKYSSRSGFISFVANNAKDYFDEQDHLDVMIDYYILTKIYDSPDVVDAIRNENDFTHYEYEMMEIASECVYEFMAPAA